ncbi:MAG TPA: tRNA (adenosine(37)-N6)-threonylcarbamoyltransferase complex dimerization subunit type 1 TsaB [Candidatus Peregrinibacteria bacterium]|nr:tRNA (adenosine(37)-N6)-threonylcarbamoyltransferase complex dimerization subunit type 1 TsaB [Candidatus Peregrinibacteria bacterium]
MSKTTVFINTAMRQTQIALLKERGQTWEKWESNYSESQTVLVNLKKLLTKQKTKWSELEGIVACHGPGGFTGTRVGVSVTNAIAFGLKIPLAKIDVFELYAQRYPEEKGFLVISKINPEEFLVRGFGNLKKMFSEVAIVSEQELIARIKKKEVKLTGEILPEEKKKLLLHKNLSWLSSRKPWQLSLEKISFQKKPVEPWYFKEAKITLSKKSVS